MGLSRSRIALQIDRLILNGITVAAGTRPSVKVGLESELARLVREHGLSAATIAPGSRPSMRSPDIVLRGVPDPVELGRQVARALFEGMTNEL